MESCTVVCERKFISHATTRSVTLEWQGCTIPLPSNAFFHQGDDELRLDITVSVEVSDAISEWSATIGKVRAPGVCIQSFALPDLRTLRMNGSEELFVPYMFGAQGTHTCPMAALIKCKNTTCGQLHCDNKHFA